MVVRITKPRKERLAEGLEAGRETIEKAKANQEKINEEHDERAKSIEAKRSKITSETDGIVDAIHQNVAAAHKARKKKIV